MFRPRFSLVASLSFLALIVAGALTPPSQPAARSGSLPAEPSAIVVGEVRRVSSDLPDVPHIEPHVAVDPTDPEHLVAGVVTIGDRTTVSALVSFDGGRTWQRSALSRCWLDPWIVFLTDGSVRAACIADADRPPLLIYASHDGGRTWAAPTEVPFAVGQWSGHPAVKSLGGYDHASLAAGPGARDDRVFVVAMQALRMDTGEVFAGPVFISSDDGGQSFGEPRRFVTSNVWANALNLLVLPGGSVGFGYVDFGVETPNGTRPLRTKRIWWVNSSDGGRTFRLPNLLAEVEGATTLPVLAADLSEGADRGRLYLAVDEIRDGSPGVYLHASRDGGLSWGPPARATTHERGPFANPVVAVNDEGTVGLAWYDGRHGTAEACWDVYFSASPDGGATFPPEVRLTPQTSCSRVPGNIVYRSGGREVDVARRWPAGGDYFGLVGGDGGSFHLLWADSRTGVYQLWTTRVEVRSPTARR